MSESVNVLNHIIDTGVGGWGDQVFSFECKELSKTGLRREFHFNLPNLDQVMNWGPTAEGLRKEMVNTQITCILLLCD